MTILFLSIEFNYCCGISQSIFSLARELKDRGHKVILGAPGGTMVEDFIKYGMGFTAVPIRPEQKRIQDFWESVYRIRKTIKECKVDVVHSHNRLADFFSLTAKFLLNTPTVITAHALVSGNRRLSFRANKIIAISNAVKKMLEQDFRIKNDRIHLIKNIPRSLQRPTEDKIGFFKKDNHISNDNFVIACIGRLHPEKGFDIFLEAVRKLNKSHIKSIIVGKGHERERLRAFVEQNKLNVIFIDELSDVGLIYSIANLIVVPSRQESAGLVAIEAGFFKKPVVATRVGGLTETIKHNESGLLVDADNPGQLSAAIERLCSNKEVAARLGKQLCDQVKAEYSASSITERVESIYKQLASKNGNSNYP